MKTTDQHMEDMASATQRLLNMIGDWDEEELKFRPTPDSWNTLQVLDHIINSEKGTLAYMMKKTSSGWQEIPMATAEDAEHSSQLDEALDSTKKWKAPSVLPDPMDERKLEDMITYWHGLRQKFRHFVESLDAEFYERQVFRHPYAGRLNLFQTLSFLEKHITHHTFQIERIVEAMQENKA
jgi:uncharacterized damage-inducible protein DinB